MSRPEDRRLEMAVSDEILTLLDECATGQLDEVPRGDIQGITEAMAKQIIKMVREAES